MRVTRHGGSLRNNEKFEVTIEVDTKEEHDKIMAACVGVEWVKLGEDGKAESISALIRPEPKPDPIVAPHFVEERQIGYISNEKVSPEFGAGGIYVQGIDGYGCSEREHERRVALLEGAGFECLRSRRARDGKYWEIWYLPHPTLAGGSLKGKSTEEIARWVMQKVVPGSVTLAGANWGLSWE